MAESRQGNILGGYSICHPDVVSIPIFPDKVQLLICHLGEINKQIISRQCYYDNRTSLGFACAGFLRVNLPALVVSVRSWLAALRGNSFSFLPLRFRHPVAVASSNARSSERFQGAGHTDPSPLLFPTKIFPVLVPLLPLPTVKLSPVFSADPSNTEAAITHSG